MKSGEEHLQRECVRLFRYMHQPLQWRMFAIPNGGQRDKVVAAKMKLTGTLSGVWDLFLSVPRNGFSGLFIEMKHGKNKLTDNQAKFQSENAKDYAFEVVYNIDQFITAINNYLN